MTITQRSMLGAELKSQYTEEARERSLANLKRGEKVPEGPILAPRELGKSRERAAAAVGVSHGYIDMAEQIKTALNDIGTLNYLANGIFHSWIRSNRFIGAEFFRLIARNPLPLRNTNSGK